MGDEKTRLRANPPVVQARAWLRALHLGVAVAFLGLFAAVTIAAKPLPSSDFLEYWQASGDLTQYTRGGVLLLLYGSVRLFWLEPYVAALAINSLAWLGVAWALWLPRSPGADRVSGGWIQPAATLALVPVGLWETGMAGIVNTDFPHASLMLVATGCTFRALEEGGEGWMRAAILTAGAGLSVRMQSVPVFVLLTVVVAGITLIHRSRRIGIPPVLRRLTTILVAASLLGGMLDYSFRLLSRRQDAIKLNDRVVFYQGILSSPCGGWSVQSTNDAFVDLEKPFRQAVSDRLAALPRGAIAARMQCKAARMARFDGFGTYWLQATLSADRTVLTRRGMRRLRLLGRTERAATRGFLLLLLLIAVWPLRAWKESWPVWLLPVAVFLLFLGQHLIVVFQPRYALTPLLWVFSIKVLLLWRDQPACLEVRPRKLEQLAEDPAECARG